MATQRRHIRSRSWVGCLNNYTDRELQQIRDHPALYVAIGFHIGERRGVAHIHFVVQYRNARVRPNFNARIHWEVRRGTIAQCLNYFNKNNRVEEFGDRPADPRGIDEVWDEFVQQIHDGNVDRDSRMYARYEGYAKRRIAELTPKVDYDGELSDKNIWICGPTGIGKSRMVRQAFPSADIYNKFANKWWDNYNGERVVLIEDLDPRQCEYLAHHMKIWSDRYSFGAEIKNGRIQVNPLYHLVVTSQYSIEECFPGPDGEAVRRRFSVLELGN